jgi:hypothetical protein
MQSALAEFEAKVRAERDKDWSFALFGDPEFVTTPEDADEKWARSNSLYVELEEADAALAEVQKCWDIDKRDIAVLREQIAALQGAVRWALSELDTPDERLHALNTNPTWSVSGIERKSKAYREAYAAATTLHWRTEELTTWREREAKP